MKGIFLVLAHASPRACTRRASLVVRVQFKIDSNFVQYTPHMALNSTIGFRPVAAAVIGNTVVTIIKFFAASVSGSSSMFSEAIHSLADTANQILLLIGLRRPPQKTGQEFWLRRC